MLVYLLAIPALCLLIALPYASRRWSHAGFSPALDSPWKAGLSLAGANLAIMAVTFGLAFLPISVSIPMLLNFSMILGPLLSFMAWGWFRRAIPLQGRRRWAATLIGMAPYMLLILFALYWTNVWVPAHESPQDDMFHAWIGGMLLMLVCAGATILGCLIIGLGGVTHKKYT